MHGELTANLERQLVRELLREYKNLNASYLRGGLKTPTIELGTAESFLGRWHQTTRTIEISRALVLGHSWGAVVEVLKHEMAHQYAHEVLGAVDETSHGRAFREVCARFGIDARASGIPSAHEADERAVTRIAKLLALAESPNRHEAEAAMAAAQKLMLKYNLEARAQESRGYEHRHLGTPSGRVSEHERMLAMILGKHFFVEVIWVPVYRPLAGKRASVLEVCGSPSNVAMAEYAHTFLSRTADDLWTAHKRASGERSNRDRRTFLTGVMQGFLDKLGTQARVHAKEGLVWVGDADLHGFYRRRHPHVRNVRYGGRPKNQAYAKGREHGQRIVLHKPVTASESRGRLLGRGS